MSPIFRIGAVLVAVAAASGFASAEELKGIELSDMDRKAEACADFYEFANGAWRAANPIPPSMSRWSRRWAAGESSKQQLKEILEETAALEDAPRGSVDQLTGDFYAACMDVDRINRLGVKPVQPLLEEIAAIKSAGDVQKAIAKLHGMAISVPFVTGAGSDNHNPNDVILQVAAGGLGLPDRDYYVKPEPRFQEAREKYRAHVARMFVLAGYAPARAKAAADTVLRMEKRLAEVSLDNVALRDPRATDHKMMFAELQKLMPRFDWTAYAKREGFAPGDVNVNEPEFMAEVDRLLAATPLADWKTYLAWHVLDSAAPALSDPFVAEDFAFNGAYLRGEKEMKPRWKRCVESTDRLLGEALGQKYVARHFPPEAKARMQEMVKNLRTAMGQTIEGLDWMSPETKARALEKLSTFNPKIGYPDRWKDYSKVPVSRGSYWDDVVAGRKFNVQDDLATIGKPVDRGRWGMTPPTSNAYYNPLLNEIVFPAGILQPPAFSMSSNDAVNYGAIGVVIGHEISHGFDDQGAQYAADGRLSNWWTEEDLKKFQARTACVAEQFDGYFIEPGIHHNGRLVLGEAIGDLAGARIAYRAFRISQEGKPPLPDAGGFTPDQQFFIAWGQFRGDSIRPELQRTMVQGDPHPVAKYRVIGPLTMLPEFQKAFSCRAGSPMTTAQDKRCEVW
jgi:putative endopeptidase